MAKRYSELFVDKKRKKYPSPGLIPKLYERLQSVAVHELGREWIAEYLSEVWRTWTPPKQYWSIQHPRTLKTALEEAQTLRRSKQATYSGRHKLPWRAYNVVTKRFVIL